MAHSTLRRTLAFADFTARLRAYMGAFVSNRMGVKLTVYSRKLPRHAFRGGLRYNFEHALPNVATPSGPPTSKTEYLRAAWLTQTTVHSCRCEMCCFCLRHPRCSAALQAWPTPIVPRPLLMSSCRASLRNKAQS